MAPFIDSDKLWNNRPQCPTDRDEIGKEKTEEKL